MPLGIPHSTFLSWDPDDQDKAIAWRSDQSGICTKCGTRDDDWRDQETKRELVPAPYTVTTKRCAGCAALAEFRQDSEDVENSQSLYLTLEPYEAPSDADD